MMYEDVYEQFEVEPTEEELQAIEDEIFEDDELIEEELDRDFLLEQQELEDYENFYGPCDYDEPW